VTLDGAPSRPDRATLARRAVVLLAGLPCAAALIAMAAQPDVAPTTRALDCTEGGCHAGTIASEFLHGPTAVSACTACHEYTDPSQHLFRLKGEGRQLCDFCHINRVGSEGTVVHAPVGDGDCLSCHDPHGGTTSKLLTHPTLPELCADCHADTLAGDHIHEPAASGECLSCHDAHTSDHTGLLIDEQPSLCLSCHESHRLSLQNDAFVHDPVQFDCLECHTTHVSSFVAQLKASPRDLCASCHEPVLAKAMSASVPHSPVTEGRACLNCHSAHTSNTFALQISGPIETCTTCHEAEAHGAEQAGQTVANNPAAPVFIDHGDQGADTTEQRPAPPAPELNASMPFMHRPVGEGDCASCHGVHGAEHSLLLELPYATGFYESYSTASYALCYNCHDERAIIENPTADGTGFRNGDENLHAVHVDRVQGRTCRACHNAHASESPAQIRRQAPYGQWEIPLNFIQTETGGSCAPGCHREEAYDRVNPAEHEDE
jgi:predicted CXXCH cytochrome family protein